MTSFRQFKDGRDWFFEKRFGLFVHWGLYAIPGWHEQHQFRRRVPRQRYVRLMRRFNPRRFDPESWLDLAEEAGMEYLCFTAKHVDGFCLWNTAQTSYNVMNTPYVRDILEMLAKACHRRKFPLCLYYSIADMHHPNYPNHNRSYELPRPDPGDEPDVRRYVEYVKRQVRELCTQYGEIHGFWWDANVMKHRDPSVNRLIRRLQPKAIINGRGFGRGDFETPERDGEQSDDERLAFRRPTEACQSLGMESWGYRQDEDYYSTAHLIRSIDRVLAKGGNYLLNVGPKADGTIPSRGVRILRAIGKWYHAVKESFQRAEPASHLTENRTVLLTKRGDHLYVHVQEPVGDGILLAPLARHPRQAILLNTRRKAKTGMALLPSHYQASKAYLRIYDLPIDRYPDSTMVIRLEGIIA